MKRIVSTLKEKWPEYIIETIVIVGSILGAFVLENWNDSRQKKNELANFYKIILLDLKKDTKAIDSLYTAFEWRSQIMKDALKLPTDLDRWDASDSLVMAIGGSPDFEMSTNGIKLLRTNLTTSDVSDDLSQRLVQFYDNSEFQRSINREAMTITLKENFMIWSDRYAFFSAAFLDGVRTEFHREIFGDPYFRNRLLLYSVVYENHWNFIKEYHKSSREFIDLLETNIE